MGQKKVSIFVRYPIVRGYARTVLGGRKHVFVKHGERREGVRGKLEERKDLLWVSLRAHGRLSLPLLLAVQAVVDGGEGPTHQGITPLSRLPTGVHPQSQCVLLLPDI